MSKDRLDKLFFNHKTGKLEYRSYFIGNKPMNLTYVRLATGTPFQVWRAVTEYGLKNGLIKVENLLEFMPKNDVGRVLTEWNLALSKAVNNTKASFRKKKSVMSNG